MPKSKKFIDKKNSVTFCLVHRSQQDPLAADENAPQRVLVPVNSEGRPPSLSNAPKRRRVEEQQKYGIFFDDDYDYLQHLRDKSEYLQWEEVRNEQQPKSKLNLPSSVFASAVEEDVGLLNKAAPHSGPRPDLDPDVVAAMDEDFDYEDPNNELEDNFIELANEEYSDDEHSDISSDFGGSNSEENDEVASLNGPQYTFADEETKSRFTEYSMTSSVMRRNEQLTLLDDRFEKMYSGYDDSEIGALDCEEIQGHVPENSKLLLQFADEFEMNRKREQLDKDILAIKNRLSQECGSSDEDDEDLVLLPIEDKKEKWDCESILSTYSNIYNHPKLITEPRKEKIKINARTGIPINVLDANKLTAKALAKLDEQNHTLCGNKKDRDDDIGSTLSKLSMLSVRPPGESPEDRKIRKSKLKEFRLERRLEKKANKEAFKEETKRQAKISINNRNNVQGNRIL